MEGKDKDNNSFKEEGTRTFKKYFGGRNARRK